MDRRHVLGAAAALVAGAVPAMAQSAPVTDRNGSPLAVGMFVYVPCLITAITPSLNPATTSVAVQTLPNVGGVEYDEGLSLIVYPAQVLKP